MKKLEKGQTGKFYSPSGISLGYVKLLKFIKRASNGNEMWEIVNLYWIRQGYSVDELKKQKWVRVK